ncbi:MAG TPA: hypothetical protein VHF86_02365 [Xanthomonadaceae bacterium]|nr:hypothetical protein [Xanthomonadaceae bacterium]
MDSNTESELRAAFAQAQARLGGRWVLAPEAEADHVVVDMDSMYGPMSWIRLHAAGKQVIGLTTSPRTQADHRLARPLDTEALASLLGAIAGERAAALPGASESAGAPPSSADPISASIAPDGIQERPAAVDMPPVAPAAPADAAVSDAVASQAAPSQPAASEPALEAPHAPPVRERGFSEWLAPGALSGRWRFVRGGASVAFDADARVYHGPAALKPLAPLFEGRVSRDDFEPLEGSAWTSAASGDAQPLVRLQWYGGLLAGKGALLPGNDPDGRYRLLKWPQTEREFPKHFRIATAMMKGPATLSEVAASSGVSAEEVADFVNASLATGYAEFVPPPAPESAEPPRSGGLLGRLRGR